MKAIYSLAVMSLMFVGANALADSLDRQVNGGDTALSAVKIVASPNFVKAPAPQPICPPAPPKPMPNYIISGPVHF
jgi:hypothetical protein